MTEIDGEEFNIRPLQYNDLPFCTALEESSFPPNEAASLETVRFVCDVDVDRVSNSRMFGNYVGIISSFRG